MEKIEWLQRRKKGIGGSDVAAILGLSPYKTAFDVWKDKTSDEVTEIPDNSRMEWGRRLEDAVVGAYIDKTGRKTQRVNELSVGKDDPFLIGNIDRLVLADDKAQVDREEMKGTGILEVKTTGVYTFKEWEGEVPSYYWCQTQHYLHIRQLAWGAFAILVGGYDFHVVNVLRDDEYLRTQNDILRKFWTEYVQTNTPPPKTWYDYERLKKITGATIPATTEVLGFCTDRSLLKAQLIDIEAKIAEKDKLIKEFIGENDVLVDDRGGVLATWKLQKGKPTFNTKKLQAEQPDIYKQYAGVGEPFRVFRPKQTGDTE